MKYLNPFFILLYYCTYSSLTETKQLGLLIAYENLQLIRNAVATTENIIRVLMDVCRAIPEDDGPGAM